jgi:asparagine N-glycosylation enzyme membrane subunit Stt3
MSDTPQSYAHHTRWDPYFHFFVLPVFVFALIGAIVHLAMGHHRLHGALLVVLAIAVLIAIFKIRLYALKVQDRVIRLEERLRLATLLPESMRPRIPELTERQLVALRFASDAELAGLAQKALDQKLSPSDIKKSIKNWRADNWRV